MILNTYHGTYSQWLDEVKPFRELQKLVRKIPKSYFTFVEKTVFANENYFFFDKKKTSGHCSACSNDVPITKGMVEGQKIKHKAVVKCPNCGKTISCISETHYNKNSYKYKLECCKWSIIPEEKDGWLIFRYVRHVKTFFTKDGEINSKEFYRTFWNEEQKYETAYQSDPFDKGFAWVPYKDPSFGFWNENTDYIFPQKTYVFNVNNLSQIISKTWAKYSGLAEYCELVLSSNPVLETGWEMEKYLELYKVKPSVEQLSKCGFDSLVKELLQNYWEQKNELVNKSNIVESLQIDKNCYNFIKELDQVSFNDIRLLKDFNKQTGRLTSYEEFSFIKKNANHIKFLYEFMKHRTLHKLNHYFQLSEQQNKPIKMCDYYDYYKFLCELELTLDNSNLFPKDFMKAHDKRYNEVMKRRDKITQEKKRKEEAMYQSLIQDKSLAPMESRDLMAIYPSNLDDLKIEGENLHHCVGGYASKVASGETTIIFIRKKSEPEKSYFTMEYKNGKIVQVRGKHNVSADENVMAFAQKVALYLESEKSKSIVAA